MFSLDAETAEERYRLEPADARTPETIYEQRWAQALLHDRLGRQTAVTSQIVAKLREDLLMRRA